MSDLLISSGETVTIDAEDLIRLSGFKWRMSGKYVTGRRLVGYKGMRHGVKRSTGRLLLHRVIVNAPKGMDVDHINMNPLDNRRCNLRLATRSQNMANTKSRSNATSAFKGVHLIKANQMWRATITVRGKTIVGGKFAHEFDAAQAYNLLAEDHFRQHARFNIPSGVIAE